PCLSAVVWDAADLPEEIVTPDRLLADRGWESPALLAEAVAARHALVTARVGGNWWHPDAAGLPADERLGVVLLGEPAMPQSAPAPAVSIRAAMLDAALAEHRPECVAILAPRPAAAL